jgi:multiple antibiotic resistance protein
VLIVAAIGGQPLLAFFGITLASFKVGGAILILLLAISMMHATPTGEKKTPEEASEAVDKESIAVVPLAIPLLAGPGAISTTLIYATERSSPAHIGLIIACCLLMSLTVGRIAAVIPVGRWLGRPGSTCDCIMGLARLAAETFASGVVALLLAVLGRGPLCHESQFECLLLADRRLVNGQCRRWLE